MITRDTAIRILVCYQEIEAAEKLLVTVDEAVAKVSESFVERGIVRGRQFEMGIPHDTGGHRLLNVAPHLALSVIRAHIADQQAKLVGANEQARIEMAIPPLEAYAK